MLRAIGSLMHTIHQHDRPPLAVVRLPVRVPYSYHGAWTPRTFGLEGRRDA